MQIEERLQLLKQVEKVAALAGLQGRIDDEGNHFVLGYRVDERRVQQVFIRPKGRDSEGREIVTLFSPARVVKKGLFSGVSKEDALDLLRRNEAMLFARFGLWEFEKQTMVVASTDALVETLDPDELMMQSSCIALAADDYEAKHGKDEF